MASIQGWPCFSTHTHTHTHTYISLVEEEHDGVHGVVPDPEAGQQDAVEVQLEDGDGNVHKQLVVGGAVREHGRGAGTDVCLCLGEQIGRILHLVVCQGNRKWDDLFKATLAILLTSSPLGTT